MDGYEYDDDVAAAPELLSVREAAERLTISEPTLWRHLKAGRLPAVRIGGSRRERSTRSRP